MASIESAKNGVRQASSHSTAPPTRYIGSARRPSNTRAPDQVTAKAVNRMALARSIEIASDTVPYMPNSTTEAARSRCAQPHQATAWMLGVLDPGEQQQQAEHGLDVDRDEKKRVDVESHVSPVRATAAGNWPVPMAMIAAMRKKIGECPDTPDAIAAVWFRQPFRGATSFRQCRAELARAQPRRVAAARASRSIEPTAASALIIAPSCQPLQYVS